MGLFDIFRGASADEKAYERVQKELEKTQRALLKQFEAFDKTAKTATDKLFHIKEIVALVTKDAPYDPRELCKQAIEFFGTRLRSQDPTVKQHIVNQGLAPISQSSNERISDYIRRESLGYLESVIRVSEAFPPTVRASAIVQIEKTFQEKFVPATELNMKPYYELSRQERDPTVARHLRDLTRWASQQLIKKPVVDEVKAAVETTVYAGDNVTVQIGKSILNGEVTEKDGIFEGTKFVLEKMISEENPDNKFMYTRLLGEIFTSGKLNNIFYNNDKDVRKDKEPVWFGGRVFAAICEVGMGTIPRFKDAQQSARETICTYIENKGEALAKDERDVLTHIALIERDTPMAKRMRSLIDLLGSGKGSKITEFDEAIIRNGGFMDSKKDRGGPK